MSIAMGRFAGGIRRWHLCSITTAESTEIRTHLFRAQYTIRVMGEWLLGEHYCLYVKITRHAGLLVH